MPDSGHHMRNFLFDQFQRMQSLSGQLLMRTFLWPILTGEISLLSSQFQQKKFPLWPIWTGSSSSHESFNIKNFLWPILTWGITLWSIWTWENFLSGQFQYKELPLTNFNIRNFLTSFNTNISDQRKHAECCQTNLNTKNFLSVLFEQEQCPLWPFITWKLSSENLQQGEYPL